MKPYQLSVPIILHNDKLIKIRLWNEEDFEYNIQAYCLESELTLLSNVTYTLNWSEADE
jgi:hypothetical protein